MTKIWYKIEHTILYKHINEFQKILFSFSKTKKNKYFNGLNLCSRFSYSSFYSGHRHILFEFDIFYELSSHIDNCSKFDRPMCAHNMFGYCLWNKIYKKIINDFIMFTIFRRINSIEPNIRACTQLLNTQISLFSTKNIPKAIKRKKSKAKDTTVSSTTIVRHNFYSFYTKIISKHFRESISSIWKMCVQLEEREEMVA